MSTFYEWTVEEVDADGDIVGTNTHESAALAIAAMRETPEPGSHWDLCLIRQQGDDDEGLLDRQWAYVRNGALPDQFDGGAKVPTKYRDELAKATEPRAA